jgi:Flp pilus assembly protein TadD
MLLQAVEVDPDNAAVAHALGLYYVRAGESKRALQSLERAAKLAPEDLRYVYVYGVALHDAGHVSDALDVLKRAHEAHPSDLDVLVALVSYSATSGDDELARRYASRIAEIEPRLGSVEQIMERLAGPN